MPIRVNSSIIISAKKHIFGHYLDIQSIVHGFSSQINAAMNFDKAGRKMHCIKIEGPIYLK